MDTELLLNKLEEQLTGDMKKDLEFLLKEASHFNHIGFPDMVNPILKLFEKKYGEEGKKMLVDKAKSTQSERKQLYKQVIIHEQNKEFNKAQDLIVKLIDTFPINRPQLKDKKLVSYMNLFEKVYYEIVVKPKDLEVYTLEEPLTTYYFHLAYILFNLEDYEETIKQLDKGLKYNEASVDSLILKAEAYYKLGNLDEFFKYIRIALTNGYNRFHMANCYFQLARYFKDINDKETAQICVLLSLNYIPNKQVKDLSMEINNLPGDNINPSNVKRMQEVLKGKEIQFGPSPIVMMTLKRMLNDQKIKEKKELRKYFLSIVFDLTKDPKTKEEIDKLNETDGEENNE